MRAILAGVVLGALTLQLPACGQREADKPVPAPSPSVTLESTETLRVEFDQPVLALDAAGEPRRWEDAYMVRLALRMSDLPTAPAFIIFVGEHRIGELGGWQGGVYFYVYDPVLLEQLAGGEIFYQIGSEERRSLDATLDIGDLKEIRTVSEGELFPDRKRAGDAEPS